MPYPGPAGVPAEAAAPLLALPGIIETPSGQAPIQAVETSGQCHQDSTSARPPHSWGLYPQLPVSTDGKGEENTGIRQRLCSAKEWGKEPHYRCPSESYYSLQFRTHVGTTMSPL